MNGTQAFNDYMREVDSLLQTKDQNPSIDTGTRDTADFQYTDVIKK